MSPMHPLVSRVLLMAGLIFAGWLLRRIGALDRRRTSWTSRIMVDILFPVLVFRQMLLSVNPSNLHTILHFSVLGCMMLGAGFGTAALVHRLSGTTAHRRTFLFCGMMPNWIFLPLAIVEPILGSTGVTIVIFFNIPMQFVLWTFCVRLLRGRMRGAHVIRMLVFNPGLLAAVSGLVMALLLPDQVDSVSQTVAGNAFFQAMYWVGWLTIPASLIILGSHIAGVEPGADNARADLIRILPIRLLVAPLLFLTGLLALHALGWTLDDDQRFVLLLISSMPVALNCSIFVDRFGGDHSLAAHAVFASTLLAFASVPLMVWAMNAIAGCFL